MNIADRIQKLRKRKGISQEELADHIGVSRQAVSKWESEQSLPEIDKLCLLSDYFGVTTDYLLKGIEHAPEVIVSEPDTTAEKPDARIFAAAGSMFNAIGLIVSVMMWIEKQNTFSVAVGLIIMVVGCMIFVIGQYIGENKEKAFASFWAVNVWFLSLIPISTCFNLINGIKGGHWWSPSPIPQMGNFLNAYAVCWMFYFAVCILVDILIIVKRGLLKKK